MSRYRKLSHRGFIRRRIKSVRGRRSVARQLRAYGINPSTFKFRF